jgi:hypothetical protein
VTAALDSLGAYGPAAVGAVSEVLKVFVGADSDQMISAVWAAEKIGFSPEHLRGIKEQAFRHADSLETSGNLATTYNYLKLISGLGERAIHVLDIILEATQIQDDDNLIVTEAVRIIGELGGVAAASEERLWELVNRDGEDEKYLRAKSAEALMAIGIEKHRIPVDVINEISEIEAGYSELKGSLPGREFVPEPQEVDEILRAAASLGALSIADQMILSRDVLDPDRHLELILKLSRSDDENGRLHACSLLQCMGSRARTSLPRLIELLDDPEPIVIDGALRAIGSMEQMGAAARSKIEEIQFGADELIALSAEKTLRRISS